jgi:alanine-glyoxylate transaminase/serine-glyoxylate transaminase/serine-pyruvate transaminase
MDPRDLLGGPELMIVGPGELHEDDLAILGSQSVAHFGPGWTEYHNATVGEVGRLLGAADPPYIIPGSGTASLDAAMMNLFSPGERVLVFDTGFFGNRLAEIARAQRLDVVVEPVEIGQPIDPARVGSGFAGVLAVHVETSTGVRHPVGELASAAHDAGAVVFVDAIASAGGELLDVDGWGLDAVVTGTQKGLESAPGLGIVALGVGGRARVDTRPERPPTFYLDLKRWDAYRVDWGPWHPHPVTMPATLVLALMSSVQRINGVGLDAWVARRAALADRCREGLRDLGYEAVAAPGVGSNMVVAVYAPDPPAIQAKVLEQGIMIAGGLAPLAGKTLRIGLMGRTATEEMVDRVLDAIARATKEP